MEEIFKGNRNLFKGLAIDQKNYHWQEYPVLYFDFAQIISETPEDFKSGLEDAIEDLSKAYGLAISGSSYTSKIKRLITTLSKKNRVVVLVDEYDSAIINHLKDPKLAEKNRDLLKAFFATLKSLDRYIQFTFVTGVSKFSQVSLFSGPNHLKDITMHPKYGAMMGYTEEELKIHFREHIQDIVKTRNEQGISTSDEKIIDEIRTWYNGYRFSKQETSVYNPFSTLNFMEDKEPDTYWYSSGTPSFLINEVRKHPQSIASLRNVSAFKSTLFDISRLDKIDLVALMFQTGYLTIHDYDASEDFYVLDFPNQEVKQAFFRSLLKDFAEVDPLEMTKQGKVLKSNLEALDLQSFIQNINTQFAKIPYSIFSQAK